MSVIGNPMKLSSHAPSTPARIPELGEDTAAVLATLLGFERAEIEALVQAGVVAVTPSSSEAARA
jgi:crotonobetainyl-CoA:carnitine CoA-transferase CaiB-like acyl-CoA transferase